MRRTFTLSFLILTLLSTQGLAQTTIPYYTGFDNTAQMSGWTTYRKGSTSNSNWSIATSGGFSPAKCLTHYYPVGGSVPTDDWYVSPGLDLSGGGTLDSVRASFSGFGTPNGNDIVAIYLLRGSPNPTLTNSDTMLLNFSGTNYIADNTWRLFTNIVLPPTPGISYIAFRYQTTVNWLDVKFDNVSLSSNSGTGIGSVAAESKMLVFPNPVKKGNGIIFKADATGNGQYHMRIFNATGVLVEEKEVSTGEAIRAEHAAGLYFYTLTKDGLYAGSGKLIIE